MKIKFKENSARGGRELVIDEDQNNHAADIVIVQKNKSLILMQNGKPINKPFTFNLTLEVAAGNRTSCTLFWDPTAKNVEKQLFLRTHSKSKEYKIFSPMQEITGLNLGPGVWADPKHAGITDYELSVSSHMIEKKNPKAANFFQHKNESEVAKRGTTTLPFLVEFRMQEYFAIVIGEVKDENLEKRKKAREAYGALITEIKKVDGKIHQCEIESAELLNQLSVVNKNSNYPVSHKEEIQKELRKQQELYQGYRNDYLKLLPYIEITKTSLQQTCPNVANDLDKRMTDIMTKMKRIENLLHEGVPNQYSKAQQRKFGLIEPEPQLETRNRFRRP